MNTNKISEILKTKFGKETPILSRDIYKNTLNISAKTFRKYVENKKQPRIDELQRIAQWLGVNPKDLY